MISNQAGSVLDFFLSREEELFRVDGAKVGLDGETSTDVLANPRRVYEQIQIQFCATPALSVFSILFVIHFLAQFHFLLNNSANTSYL